MVVWSDRVVLANNFAVMEENEEKQFVTRASIDGSFDKLFGVSL